MPNVLPYIPSFGESLAPILTQVGGAINAGIQKRVGDKKDAQIFDQLQNTQTPLSPLQQISLISKLSPERQKTAASLLGPILKEQEKGAQQANLARAFLGGPDAFNQFLGGMGEAPQGDFATQFQGGMPQQTGDLQNIKPSTHTPPGTERAPGQSGIRGYSKEQLYGAMAIPGLAKPAEAILNQQNERESRDFKRNEKYAEHIEKIRMDQNRKSLALQQMRGALESGDFESLRNTVANFLGADFLKTADAQTVNAAIKNFLISDLGQITGNKNVFLEKQITSALINPAYAPAANRLILEGLENLERFHNLEVEAYDRMEQEYLDAGREPPRNFASLVRKSIQPEISKWEKSYEEKVRDQLGQAPTKEKAKAPPPLKKVKKGTKLTDRDKAQQILNQAGGDHKKAEQLARALGYEVEEIEE